MRRTTDSEDDDEEYDDEEEDEDEWEEEEEEDDDGDAVVRAYRLAALHDWDDFRAQVGTAEGAAEPPAWKHAYVGELSRARPLLPLHTLHARARRWGWAAASRSEVESFSAVAAAWRAWRSGAGAAGRVQSDAAAYRRFLRRARRRAALPGAWGLDEALDAAAVAALDARSPAQRELVQKAEGMLAAVTSGGDDDSDAEDALSEAGSLVDVEERLELDEQGSNEDRVGLLTGLLPEGAPAALRSCGVLRARGASGRAAAWARLEAAAPSVHKLLHATSLAVSTLEVQFLQSALVAPALALLATTLALEAAPAGGPPQEPALGHGTRVQQALSCAFTLTARSAAFADFGRWRRALVAADAAVAALEVLTLDPDAEVAAAAQSFTSVAHLRRCRALAGAGRYAAAALAACDAFNEMRRWHALTNAAFGEESQARLLRVLCYTPACLFFRDDCAYMAAMLRLVIPRVAGLAVSSPTACAVGFSVELLHASPNAASAHFRAGGTAAATVALLALLARAENDPQDREAWTRTIDNFAEAACMPASPAPLLRWNAPDPAKEYAAWAVVAAELGDVEALVAALRRPRDAASAAIALQMIMSSGSQESKARVYASAAPAGLAAALAVCARARQWREAVVCALALTTMVKRDAAAARAALDAGALPACFALLANTPDDDFLGSVAACYTPYYAIQYLGDAALPAARTPDALAAISRAMRTPGLAKFAYLPDMCARLLMHAFSGRDPAAARRARICFFAECSGLDAIASGLSVQYGELRLMLGNGTGNGSVDRLKHSVSALRELLMLCDMALSHRVLSGDGHAAGVLAPEPLARVIASIAPALSRQVWTAVLGSSAEYTRRSTCYALHGLAAALAAALLPLPPRSNGTALPEWLPTAVSLVIACIENLDSIKPEAIAALDSLLQVGHVYAPNGGGELARLYRSVRPGVAPPDFAASRAAAASAAAAQPEARAHAARCAADEAAARTARHTASAAAEAQARAARYAANAEAAARRKARAAERAMEALALREHERSAGGVGPSTASDAAAAEEDEVSSDDDGAASEEASSSAAPSRATSTSKAKGKKQRRKARTAAAAAPPPPPPPPPPLPLPQQPRAARAPVAARPAAGPAVAPAARRAAAAPARGAASRAPAALPQATAASLPAFAFTAAYGVDEEADECCLCMDAPPAARLLPCGHRLLCLACTLQIICDKGICPVCRAPIQTFSEA